MQVAFLSSVSFQRGHVSLYSMFVQAPQIIKQRSDNSEDDSDEEGPEDVLQVNFPQQEKLAFCKISLQ